MAVYPRLNQGEWASPLVHSQHNMDSVVGGGAQDKRKIYTNYDVFL